MNTAAQISRPSKSRRQPLLHRGGSTVAEICGGTAAGCAAVCCCCPCGLINLFFLAVYKVPAGIYHRALRRRRRRLKQQIKHAPSPQVGHTNANLKRCRCGCGDSEFGIHPLGRWGGGEEEDESSSASAAAAALDKEMLDRFYGGGFWRSFSQRETVRTGLLRGPLAQTEKTTVL